MSQFYAQTRLELLKPTPHTLPCPPIREGFVPVPMELGEYIDKSEKLAEMECTTLLELVFSVLEQKLILRSLFDI